MAILMVVMQYTHYLVFLTTTLFTVTGWFHYLWLESYIPIYGNKDVKGTLIILEVLMVTNFV